MINKIIIKPTGNQTPSGMVLGGSYQCGPGMIRVLISEDSFIEVQDSDKTAPAAMNIMFSERTPVFTITYDPEAKSDKKKKDVIDIFFGQHPLLTRNGKPTQFTRSGMYDMYSEQDKSNIEYDLWKENLDVMNRVNNMTNSDLRDVWYWYGIEPSGKKRGELIVRLAGSSGLAIGDIDLATQKNKFLMMFAAESKAETDYTVNMRKALMAGIIENRMEGDRSNYYHGTTFIGTSFNDVVAYAKREDRIYQEHILPKITEVDSLMSINAPSEDDPFTKKTGRKPRVSDPDQ